MQLQYNEIHLQCKQAFTVIQACINPLVFCLVNPTQVCKRVFLSNARTQAQSTTRLFFCSVFKRMFSFWLVQSNAFDSSNQTALLLFSVLEQPSLEQKKQLVDWVTNVDM
jgi:hypothetical protein